VQLALEHVQTLIAHFQSPRVRAEDDCRACGLVGREVCVVLEHLLVRGIIEAPGDLVADQDVAPDLPQPVAVDCGLDSEVVALLGILLLDLGGCGHLAVFAHLAAP